MSSFIESSASFCISASKKEFWVVVSLKIRILSAAELLINPVNKKSNRHPFSLSEFNLSIIFVSNAIAKKIVSKIINLYHIFSRNAIGLLLLAALFFNTSFTNDKEKTNNKIQTTFGTLSKLG